MKKSLLLYEKENKKYILLIKKKNSNIHFLVDLFLLILIDYKVNQIFQYFQHKQQNVLVNFRDMFEHLY